MHVLVGELLSSDKVTSPTQQQARFVHMPPTLRISRECVRSSGYTASDCPWNSNFVQMADHCKILLWCICVDLEFVTISEAVAAKSRFHRYALWDDE